MALARAGNQASSKRRERSGSDAGGMKNRRWAMHASHQQAVESNRLLLNDRINEQQQQQQER